MLEHLKNAVALSHHLNTLYSMKEGVREIEKICKYTLYKVGKAIEILHRNDLVHGDLKTSNILCDIDTNDSSIRIVTKATAFSK